MQSLAHYEKAFLTAFRTFYGDPAGWSLYGLLPNYLQREGSSLVYMADRLIAACGSGGFYLDDYEKTARGHGPRSEAQNPAGCQLRTLGPRGAIRPEIRKIRS